MASQRMVPGPLKTLIGLPKAPPAKSTSTQITSLLEVSPGIIRSCSDRLQTVRRPVRAKGFSRSVAEAVARCRRQSSCQVYQTKWAVIRRWCSKHNISSSKTSLTQIADFLLYLRTTKGLSSSTMKGYRSILSSVFKNRDLDLSSNQDLSNLIKSFDTSKQTKVDSVSWNLDVVLKWLMGPSFESLSSMSLKNLTQKTLFLVALATAKCVSELQAIDKWIGFARRYSMLVYSWFLGQERDTFQA